MPDATWTLALGGKSVTMGPGSADAFNTAEPDLGDTTIESEDASLPRTDGLAFGMDYRRGRTITFEMGVGLSWSESAARAKCRELAAVWRGDAIRRTPWAVASLSVNSPNRVMYGRPRRFKAGYEMAYQGYIPVLADFQTVDDLIYDGTSQSVTVASGGSVGITIGGDVATWPIFKFNGPSTNAEATISGEYSIGLSAVIGNGSSVTLDARPWKRTALHSNGTSLAGKLTGRPLRRSYLEPGSYTLSLSGGSSMELTWRNAYASL